MTNLVICCICCIDFVLSQSFRQTWTSCLRWLNTCSATRCSNFHGARHTDRMRSTPLPLAVVLSHMCTTARRVVADEAALLARMTNLACICCYRLGWQHWRSIGDGTRTGAATIAGVASRGHTPTACALEPKLLRN